MRGIEIKARGREYEVKIRCQCGSEAFAKVKDDSEKNNSVVADCSCGKSYQIVSEDGLRVWPIEVVTSWCVNCRRSVEIKNPRLMTTKYRTVLYYSPTYFCQGECPVCGASIYRMGVSQAMIDAKRAP